MNAKHDDAGRARRHLSAGPELDDRDRQRAAARVILPITDPYVVHHGALGSALPRSICPSRCRTSPPRSPKRLRRHADGIESGARPTPSRLQPPSNWRRIGMGDLVVIKHHPQGARHHRRRAMICPDSTVPLRSHGGISEQVVPLICSTVPWHATAMPGAVCAISISIDVALNHARLNRGLVMSWTRKGKPHGCRSPMRFSPVAANCRHEPMWIAGRKVEPDRVIEVLNPYDNSRGRNRAARPAASK